MGVKSLFSVLFSIFPLDFLLMKLFPSNCWNLRNLSDMQRMRQSKLLLHIWSFGGFQNVKNTNFGNPVFNKAKRWNLMTYFPHAGIMLKTWNIQLILAKSYPETSKTRPSTCLLKVILDIFHPSPKTPNFCGTEPKHVKSSFLKACLPICMENIQREELKDELIHRRSKWLAL